jgi:hypothetical protein
MSLIEFLILALPLFELLLEVAEVFGKTFVSGYLTHSALVLAFLFVLSLVRSILLSPFALFSNVFKRKGLFLSGCDSAH